MGRTRRKLGARSTQPSLLRSLRHHDSRIRVLDPSRRRIQEVPSTAADLGSFDDRALGIIRPYGAGANLRAERRHVAEAARRQAEVEARTLAAFRPFGLGSGQAAVAAQPAAAAGAVRPPLREGFFDYPRASR